MFATDLRAICAHQEKHFSAFGYAPGQQTGLPPGSEEDVPEPPVHCYIKQPSKRKKSFSAYLHELNFQMFQSTGEFKTKITSFSSWYFVLSTANINYFIML